MVRTGRRQVTGLQNAVDARFEGALFVGVQQPGELGREAPPG
jgi:hypothetical protein